MTMNRLVHPSKARNARSVPSTPPPLRHPPAALLPDLHNNLGAAHVLLYIAGAVRAQFHEMQSQTVKSVMRLSSSLRQTPFMAWG
jgi:hypothetical protein